MRVVCIANPVSGRRGVDEIIAAVGARLRARGIAFERLVTARAGHARDLAAEATGADAILCCGGDGTLCDVINGLNGRGTPLAILPAGTENILAKELNCLLDAEAIVRSLLGNRTVRFDVGLANGTRFLIVVGVGFDAEVVRRLTQRRQGHISYLTYARPIGDTLCHYDFPRLTVTVDGGAVFDDHGIAIIGNLSRYSMGLRILGRARPDDGLLDVCAFPCRGTLRLLQHAADVFWNRHLDRDGVVYAQGRRISVTSPYGADVQIDGEWAGVLPLNCSVNPAEVSILVDPLRGPE